MMLLQLGSQVLEEVAGAAVEMHDPPSSLSAPHAAN